MSLRDCYIQHSGYFLSLREKMNRYMASVGLNVPDTEVIKAFCDAFGNLPLDTVEDYSKALDEFRAFAVGVSWAMQQ